MAQNTMSVYQWVIDDVISGSRSEFVQAGVNETVLDRLRSKWEAKIVETGATAAAADELRRYSPTSGQHPQVITQSGVMLAHPGVRPGGMPGLVQPMRPGLAPLQRPGMGGAPGAQPGRPMFQQFVRPQLQAPRPPAAQPPQQPFPQQHMRPRPPKDPQASGMPSSSSAAPPHALAMQPPAPTYQPPHQGPPQPQLPPAYQPDAALQRAAGLMPHFSSGPDPSASGSEHPPAGVGLAFPQHAAAPSVLPTSAPPEQPIGGEAGAVVGIKRQREQEDRPQPPQRPSWMSRVPQGDGACDDVCAMEADLQHWGGPDSDPTPRPQWLDSDRAPAPPRQHAHPTPPAQSGEQRPWEEEVELSWAGLDRRGGLRAGRRIPQFDGDAGGSPAPADAEDAPAAPEEVEEDLDDIQVSDEEDWAEDDTTNRIVAQYEKVKRTRNRWKVMMKNGIALINGKEYLFSKATGEFVF